IRRARLAFILLLRQLDTFLNPVKSCATQRREQRYVRTCQKAPGRRHPPNRRGTRRSDASLSYSVTGFPCGNEPEAPPDSQGGLGGGGVGPLGGREPFTFLMMGSSRLPLAPCKRGARPALASRSPPANASTSALVCCTTCNRYSAWCMRANKVLRIAP